MTVLDKLMKEIESLVNKLPSLQGNQSQYLHCLNNIKQLQEIYSNLK